MYIAEEPCIDPAMMKERLKLLAFWEQLPWEELETECWRQGGTWLTFAHIFAIGECLRSGFDLVVMIHAAEGLQAFHDFASFQERPTVFCRSFLWLCGSMKAMFGRHESSALV